MQVHKENIEKVPNSIKGRDNITLEICGMDNIPEEDLIEHEKQKSAQIVREGTYFSLLPTFLKYIISIKKF